MASADSNCDWLGALRRLAFNFVRRPLSPRRFDKKVRMRAGRTICTSHDSLYRIHKLSRQLPWLSGPGEKLRCDLSRNGAVLLHEIKWQLPLPAAKYQLRPDPRTRPFLLRAQFMSRNQQLIRVFDTQCLDAHQRWGENNSVVTVARQRIRPDKPWQALSAFSAEGYVMAKPLNRSAGFRPRSTCRFVAC